MSIESYLFLDGSGSNPTQPTILALLLPPQIAQWLVPTAPGQGREGQARAAGRRGLQCVRAVNGLC